MGNCQILGELPLAGFPDNQGREQEVLRPCSSSKDFLHGAWSSLSTFKQRLTSPSVFQSFVCPSKHLPNTDALEGQLANSISYPGRHKAGSTMTGSDQMQCENEKFVRRESFEQLAPNKY